MALTLEIESIDSASVDATSDIADSTSFVELGCILVKTVLDDMSIAAELAANGRDEDTDLDGSGVADGADVGNESNAFVAEGTADDVGVVSKFEETDAEDKSRLRIENGLCEAIMDGLDVNSKSAGIGVDIALEEMAIVSELDGRVVEYKLPMLDVGDNFCEL